MNASTCTAVCSCAVNDDVKGVPVMFSHSVVHDTDTVAMLSSLVRDCKYHLYGCVPVYMRR